MDWKYIKQYIGGNMRRCVFAAVKRKPVAETFDFLSRDGALGAHSVLTQCWTQCAPHWDATLHRTLLRRTLGRSSGDSSAAGGRASPRLLRRFLPAAEAGARWSWEEVAGVRSCLLEGSMLSPPLLAADNGASLSGEEGASASNSYLEKLLPAAALSNLTPC